MKSYIFSETEWVRTSRNLLYSQYFLGGEKGGLYSGVAFLENGTFLGKLALYLSLKNK